MRLIDFFVMIDEDKNGLVKILLMMMMMMIYILEDAFEFL